MYNCEVKNNEHYSLLYLLLLKMNIPFPESMEQGFKKEYDFIDIFSDSDGYLYVNQRRTKSDYEHIRFDEMLEIIMKSNNKECLRQRELSLDKAKSKILTNE